MATHARKLRKDGVRPMHNRHDTAIRLRIERALPAQATASLTSPSGVLIEHSARYPTLEQAHQAAANFLATSPRIIKVYLLNATDDVLTIVTRQATSEVEVSN